MLTGGIDLSVASVATGAAYLLATNASNGSATAIGLALLLGVIVGIINGIGVALLRVQAAGHDAGHRAHDRGRADRLQPAHDGEPAPMSPTSSRRSARDVCSGWVPIDLFLWLIVAALILFGLPTDRLRPSALRGRRQSRGVSSRRRQGVARPVSSIMCCARSSRRSPGLSWSAARTRPISALPTAISCPRSPAWSSAARRSSAGAAAIRGPSSAR